MTIHVPLSPGLEQFVREQLTIGRFESESDVIYAALLLLKEQSPPQHGATQLKQALNRECNVAAPYTGARRSPRGILADIRSYISPDDIRVARSEMWAGFPRGEV